MKQFHTPSFRDGPKDQTRNLEIPGSRFAHPGMTGKAYGHFTSGGIDDNIESTLPPVFRPNVVPRS
jgi:hypothetical protein